MLALLLLTLIIKTSYIHYLLNSSNVNVTFSNNVSNSLLICNNASILNVYFLNNTYNNTIENCSINGKVYSKNNAQNNLINDSGDYSLNFSDNNSNIGIGYFLKVIIHLNNASTYGVARFVEILPYNIVNENPYLISMSANNTTLSNTISKSNYTIPRFGIQLNASVNGIGIFPIEIKQVYKNKIINYNPYIYETPYSGYDEVDRYVFNMTNNIVYEPAFIKPLMYFAEPFPANKPMIIRFFIQFYNNTKWNKFIIYNEPQSFINATPIAIFNNVTSGVLTYNAGFEKPGNYGFYAILNTNYDHENTTSPFYSIGLGFCNQFVTTLNTSGYYPFVYNTLKENYIFWLTNNTCNIGLRIISNNITVNCRYGYLNDNQTDIEVDNAKNVTIENCYLYKNGINATNSEINLYNVTFIPTNSSYSISGTNLTIIASNVLFKSNAIINSNSINIISKNTSKNITKENYTHYVYINESLSNEKIIKNITNQLYIVISIIVIALLGYAYIIIKIINKKH